MEVCLARLNRVQAKQRVDQGAVALLAVGSIEQHGEHLPLDTDTLLVSAIAEGAAKSVYPEVPVVVAPPVSVGCSLHHMQYAGTMSLEFETFNAMLYEMAGSLAAHGFKKLLLLNGHGGNAAAMSVVANKLMLKNVFPLVIFANYWSLISEEIGEIRESGLGGVGHACELETSLSLYLRPELVQKDKMIRSMAQPRINGDSLDLAKGPCLVLPWIVHKDTPSGVIGDPFLATAEKGEKLYNAAVQRIGQLLRDMYVR